MLYHLGVPGVRGGFAGVDVFFVISGYLITSLLVREATRDGRISIPRFYARRARRLLPAACLVLVSTAVAGWLLLPVSSRGDLATDVVTATLYVVNWALARRSVDYLAEGAGVSPLQHYWSLSVEEQYYLVWPLLMLLGLVVARRIGVRPKPVLGGLIAVVLVASLAYSVVHTASDPAASYFVTTTRVWELAIGSLLAFGTERLSRLRLPWSGLLAWTGLLLLVVATFAISSHTAWPGYAALVPTLGAAAMIAGGCGTADTPAQRLVRSGPFVWVGGLSYSLYLWHWPLIVLAHARFPDRTRVQGFLLGLVVLVLAVGLAWLTKRLLEDPFRFRFRVVASTRGALLTGAALMTVAVLGGVAVGRSVPSLGVGRLVPGATALVADPSGVPWRVLDDPTTVYDRSGPIVPDPARATVDIPPYYADGCQVAQGDPKPDDACVYSDTSSSTTIVLLGDSKMGQWFSAVRAIADRQHWRLRLYLKSACTFSLGGVKPDCAAHTRAALQEMAAKPPRYAVVSQGSAESAALDDGMRRALQRVRALGTTVVVLADNPTPDGAGLPGQPDQRQVYTCIEQHPTNYRACSTPRGSSSAGAGTPALRTVASALHLPFVDLGRWVCPPGPDYCPAVVGHTLVYRQGSHLTDSYVRTLTPMLDRALAQAHVTPGPLSRIRLDEVPASRVTAK